jgi:hypothetical protein
MRFGLDRLLADPALRAPLKGQRVALLAHPASLTPEMTPSARSTGCAGRSRPT